MLSDIGGEKARDVKIIKILKNHAAIHSVLCLSIHICVYL